MTEFQPIRRYPDGSIDYRFYHARTAVLRSRAIREAFKFKATLKYTAIATAAVVGIALLAAARSEAGSIACNSCVSAAQTAVAWAAPPTD